MKEFSSHWRIVSADYNNPAHAQAIIALLNEYASGPSGGGEALAASVKAELIPALQRSNCALYSYRRARFLRISSTRCRDGALPYLEFISWQRIIQFNLG